MSTDTEVSDTMQDVIPIAASIMDVPIFAYVGHLLFEDPLFGAVVGVLTGIASHQFLSFQFDRQAATPESTDDPGSHADGSPGRLLHRGAVGAALGPAGMVLFVWQFLESDLLLGGTVAVLYVLVAYVVFERLLPPDPVPQA